MGKNFIILKGIWTKINQRFPFDELNVEQQKQILEYLLSTPEPGVIPCSIVKELELLEADKIDSLSEETIQHLKKWEDTILEILSEELGEL